MAEKDLILSFEPIFIARQPVFTADEQLWAHELLFRSSGTATSAVFSDTDQATSRVIADGFTLVQSGPHMGKRVLINFPRNLILEEAAFALPPELAIIEILETVKPEPPILKALENLKSSGYTLALDDYVGKPGAEPLLDLVDIVKVDILGVDRLDLARIVSDLQKRNVKLLAEKVEDLETFDQTKRLGFQLFQGFFFSKPVIVPGRKLNPNQSTRLRLLKELAREDFEVKDLAEIIRADLPLSYRLFRYINSASFGFRTKINSVNHAISLIGQRQLKKWLWVVFMSDLSSSPMTGELAFMSAHRGRFLELMTDVMGTKPMNSDAMFLLGLFSLLDAILGLPMNELVADLPIGDDIKVALCKGKNPNRVWLELVKSFERAQWKRAEFIMQRLSLNHNKIAGFYSDALSWTNEILTYSKPEAKEE